MRLERSFFQNDAVPLARDLIGKIFCHQTPEGRVTGRVVEAEAYVGPLDKAAHALRGGRNGRARVWYGPGGYGYVYLIYGLHLCTNIVAGPVDCPQAVLLRALEPLEGQDLMRRRRGRSDHLCDGPGRLSQAMGVTIAHYGADFCSPELFFWDDGARPPVLAVPRVNVDYAGDDALRPWRFLIPQSPFLSVKP